VLCGVNVIHHATRAVASEAAGTAFLLATVVGSGIMGERLAGGNVAIALLANSLATGTALAVLILAYGPISGAHFNPLVTMSEAVQGRLPWTRAWNYVVAQLVGAVGGVVAAHMMFSEPLLAVSMRVRSGGAQVFSESVATFGLLTVIANISRTRLTAVPFAVGAYIIAAYWFTSSTSFANPAVTIARAFTDTFAGIRPVDVPGFLAGQMAGAVAAILMCRWLAARDPRADVVAQSGATLS
jgi:glycerol uptake facilitator-like aquaporin